MAKKKSPTTSDIDNNWLHLFNSLYNENDAICVIVGTSYVDTCLGVLLETFFEGDDKAQDILRPHGDIPSLSEKAKLAYLLRLISKGCLENISHIGNLRNLFAHRIGEINFDNGSIPNKDAYIVKYVPGQPRRLPIIGDPNELLGHLVTHTTPRESPPTAKEIFAAAITQTCTFLQDQARELKAAPARSDNWDHQSS